MSERPPLPPRPGAPSGRPSGEGGDQGIPPRPKPPSRPSAGPQKKAKRPSASPPSLPDLPSIKDIEWQEIPLRARVWWAGASRRKRIWVSVVAILGLFFLMRLMGCGSSVSNESTLRSGGNKETAALLDQAKAALDKKSIVYSKSASLGADVFFDRKEERLLISTPKVTTLISKDGQRLNYDPSGCFYGAGRSASPSAGAVVLPLSEPSANFSEVDRQGDFTYLPFESQRLGNWGPGAGSLVLDSSNLPVAFNYTLSGKTEENRFRITYPDKFPSLKLKRC